MNRTVCSFSLAAVLAYPQEAVEQIPKWATDLVSQDG